MKRGISIISTAVAAVLVVCAGAQAQEPVRIGVLGPYSGPYAIIGEEVANGFELYFEEIDNMAAGRAIEMIVEDTQGKPDVGLTKVQKLVERDKVDFLGGIVSSSVAYAVRDYIVDSGVPLLISVASADGLTKQQAAPTIFRTNTSGSQNSHPFGQWLYDQGYRKLIMLAPNYAMGYEQTGGFARTFVEAGGEIVETIYPPVGAADFGPFLTSFDPSEGDAVGAVFAGSDAIKFVKQFEEYGLKGTIPLLGTSLLTDDLILQQQGDAALGIRTAGHYSAVLDNPENKAFVEAYEAKYGRLPTVYAEGAYVGARVLHDALDAVEGDISDREALLEAISKAEFAAPRGPFRFGELNAPVHMVYVMEVQKVDGQLANVPVAELGEVSQFYKWTPEEFMSMPSYSDVADQWVK